MGKDGPQGWPARIQGWPAQSNGDERMQILVVSSGLSYTLPVVGFTAISFRRNQNRLDVQTRQYAIENRW